MPDKAPIDRYVLYGEPVREVELNFLHVEPIRDRSGRYGWTIAPHSHGELHQVLLVAAGGGAMRVEAEALEIRAPALLLVPSGTVHGFAFSPGTDGWVGSIAEPMVTELLGDDPVLRDLFGPARCINAIAPAARAAVQDAFEALARELVWTASGRSLAIRAELLRLLVMAYRLAEGDRGETASATADAVLTERFRRLIDRNFHRGEPVSAYARELGVSEDRLLAACQRRFGETPLAMIHRRLVLEAQRWLVYTPKPVSEIGHELGFADPAYFSRFFKRRTGTTPTIYRARSRSAPPARGP